MSTELTTFLKNTRLIGSLISELKEAKRNNEEDNIQSLLNEFEKNDSRSILTLTRVFYYYNNRYVKASLPIKIDFDFLVISRFFFKDWKSFIKNYIRDKINKGNSLQSVKNELVKSLGEFHMNTGLNFTWDMYNDIRIRLFKYSWSRYDATDEIYNISIRNISEDILWINNLTKKHIDQPKKIILNDSIKQKDLINVLHRLIYDKKLIPNYQHRDKTEITNFIYHISNYKRTTTEVIDSNYNLNFNKKNGRIFILSLYYLQVQGVFLTKHSPFFKSLSQFLRIRSLGKTNLQKLREGDLNGLDGDIKKYYLNDLKKNVKLKSIQNRN